MSKIFISIYEWFERHRGIFYLVLISSVVLFAAMALQLKFEENITNFFGDSEDEKNSTFQTIEAKDKIVVMLAGDNPDNIIASAEIFEAQLQTLVEEGLVSSVTAYADEQTIERCTSFIYDYLPIFLTEADYCEMERRVTDESVGQAVQGVYNILTSPSGMVVGDILMRDPLNIATHLLQRFEQFNPNLQYEIYNGRLFTSDLSTMLMFVQPSNGMGETGNNDRLVSVLEDAERSAEINSVEIDCIGGPIVAVYNARQIKRDTSITMGLAMLFILLVIFLSFRNRWSIPYIIVPPIYGALFALAMVWLVQGEISTIAIGAGTVILGVALSYSIHIVAHLNHSTSPKEIIAELAMPLTIGCFTTIGAFAALMFTSSALLQDMGLFSLFTLVGTTLFSLVFLPQFLKGFAATGKSPLLKWIERVVGYRYDGKRWVVLPILLTAFVALFFYQDVEFDDDMSHINYMPEHIVEAERRSVEMFGDESRDVYIVTGSNSLAALSDEYAELERIVRQYCQSGKIESVATVSDFVLPLEEQQRRIERWNNFWAQHCTSTLASLERSAKACGFREGAFDGFERLISRDFTTCSYTEEQIGDVPIVSEWINSSDGHISLLSRIVLDEENKAEIYGEIDGLPNTAIIDRSYFSSKMVEATSDDFNYILLVSSLIVFVALLISYGRIELTLLTFLPMAISWVIILGAMALFDIKFNIVNIILATFIFGIGDDFSIFIMDGLLQEYRDGRKMLNAHKTAIFFSAFTAIVGMGVLIFAQHPALKSIALISVLGLSVVVLVSYTIQPLLFGWLVTSQTKRGGFPYTIVSILNTLYCFLYFLFGCILAQLYILVLMLLPIGRRRKKLLFHRMVYRFARLFLRTMITVKTVRRNPAGESYERPAVIVANHQSFIDILLMLSTSPKIVMVTNSWVWNSPFFGWIVRYADFHHSADGYEKLAERLRKRVEEGYSIVIFPEGTRSADCSIQRFHKGAFYLARLLKLDILPMIIYGAGQVSTKKQGFYIKSGIIATKTMPRIAYGDNSYGATYQEQSKVLRRWFIEEYRIFRDELGLTSDPYFKDALIKNYIYKGPVLEWYMRVKCRLDGYYDLWDRLIPRNATIVDMGCGYGQMSFMLAMLASERDILGIDYDREKIALASHSFLCRRCNVKFECADMRSVELPQADVVLFNDSLHYVDVESQRDILHRAIASLNGGGMVVVRDGDVSQRRGHDKVEHTEMWSTRILKFNKTTDNLHFVSAEWMKELADANGVDIEIRRCDGDTSETLYILTKRSDEGV